MPIGARIRDSIDEAIRESGKVILILSTNSMASSWVEKEVETAFDEEQRRHYVVIFPIRLDSSPLESTRSWIADIRRSRNIGDFSGWKNRVHYTTAFSRLLQDLQRNANSDT